VNSLEETVKAKIRGGSPGGRSETRVFYLYTEQRTLHWICSVVSRHALCQRHWCM